MISKFRTSIRKITPDSIKQYPWLSIAIFLAVAWFILTKIGNTATLLGNWVRQLTHPDSGAVQEQSEKIFDSSSGLTAAQSAKARSDAHSISVSLGTYKGSTFWNRYLFVFLDFPVYNVLKVDDYKNPLLVKALKKAYTSLYTDGRDLGGDLKDYISIFHRDDLVAKGIM
jgi:hypothetical protein